MLCYRPNGPCWCEFHLVAWDKHTVSDGCIVNLVDFVGSDFPVIGTDGIEQDVAIASLTQRIGLNHTRTAPPGIVSVVEFDTQSVARRKANDLQRSSGPRPKSKMAIDRPVDFPTARNRTEHLSLWLDFSFQPVEKFGQSVPVDFQRGE